MPLVTISAVPPPEPSRVDGMLDEVVRATATALGREPADIWARFESISHAHAGEVRECWNAQHPIVTVSTREQPRDVVERTLRAVAGAVAIGLEIDPDAVWGRWVTLPAGSVLSDGKLT